MEFFNIHPPLERKNFENFIYPSSTEGYFSIFFFGFSCFLYFYYIKKLFKKQISVFNAKKFFLPKPYRKIPNIQFSKFVEENFSKSKKIFSNKNFFLLNSFMTLRAYGAEPYRKNLNNQFSNFVAENFSKSRKFFLIKIFSFEPLIENFKHPILNFCRIKM